MFLVLMIEIRQADEIKDSGGAGGEATYKESLKNGRHNQNTDFWENYIWYVVGPISGVSASHLMDPEMGLDS